MEEIDWKGELALCRTSVRYCIGEILTKDKDSRIFTIRCHPSLAYQASMVIKELHKLSDIFLLKLVIDLGYEAVAYSISDNRYIMYGEED